MTLPSWPAQLPRPTVDGFSLARGDNRRRSGGEQGPPRVRRGWSKTPKAMTASFFVSMDDLARFDRFYDEDTGEGALPFLMEDPTTSGQPLLIESGLLLLTDTGSPILIVQTWVCMFGSSVPAVTPMGLDWRVSFDLVVLP